MPQFLSTFTFVVILCLIILTCDFSIILLCVSLAFNLFLISNETGPIIDAASAVITPAVPAASLAESSVTQAATSTPLTQEIADYNNWLSYRNTPMASAPVLRGTDIDTRAAMLSGSRCRDKRAIDGAASKDAAYFKYHYGAELEEQEAKPWWSATEY